MAGYVYLTDQLKRDIGQTIDNTFHELDIRTPPIDYEALYKNERLAKQTMTIDKIKALGIKNIGSIKNDLRGLLFAQEKHVFIIDDEGYIKRINFVLGHELGHWKLPWHRAALFKCTQFDLSAAARKQLEIEANYYSSEFGFMRGLFTNMLSSSALSLGNIKDLSDIFDMSIESTLRRAVELEIRPCALLSLIINEKQEKDFLTIRYRVHSENFKKNIGEMNGWQTFGRNHALSEIVTNPVTNLIGECECEIFFGDKKTPLVAQVWKNRWNIFALFQPE